MSKDDSVPNLRVGDKVIISQHSMYYGRYGKTNPIGVVGVIQRIVPGNELPIHVAWDNGWTNTYRQTDLEISSLIECDRATKKEWEEEPTTAAELVAKFKETNPKDAVGTAKVPMSTVPLPVLMELGLAMMEGARKYRRHNYRIAGIRASVYFDAAMRHLFAWWEGEDTDPDSGLSHIVKTIATLVVLRDAQMAGKCTDDRPPVVHKDFVKRMNELAKQIIEKYPDGKEPYTNESSK